MATPSGQISLGDVNTELGLSPTAVITMNDAAVRTLAGVGGSGTPISMQNLQNKSNRVTASATIGSNTSNYTLDTAKAPGYSSGKTDMTLTISPGIYVSSGSTGSYALTVNTSWNAADTVTIVNNGIIIGRGGNGGSGSQGNPGGPGSSAGPALLVQRAITMNNLNRIAGGGGGGGAGGGTTEVAPEPPSAVCAGGGGGGGIGVASGGSGGGGSGGGGGGGPGGSGTLTSTGGGGGGASGGGGQAGSGGSGGTYGSSGSGGTPGTGTPNDRPGGSGGGAGACIVGNSFITYTNTGTRNGSIS
jgi:hypothetical protein